MRDMTILGGYTGARTPASTVDARVKIVLLLAGTVAVFASSGPVALALWFAMLALCMRAARMDARGVVRSLRPVCVILAFTLAANLISCDGHAAVVLAGPLGLNPAGGMRGLAAVLRIVLLVGFSLVVASSTVPTQLSDACVRLLRPLARLGLPVGALGTVLSLALRFIPIVAEELERIRMAQRARGVRFDRGPLVQRISAWASVLTPLIVGLFRRADRLADAMAARCYAESGAVALAPAPLSRRDRMLLAGGLLLMVAVVLAARLL